MDSAQRLLLEQAWNNISSLEKTLLQRILDISFKHRLSHLGSCLSALPLIYRSYLSMKKEDIFLLSSGHAGLALYTVLESIYNFDAEALLEQHGVHPNRDPEHKIFCSTGSLGLGLPVAVGAALANPNRQVFCLISDGECAEGSIWEALRFIQEQRIENLNVVVNANGFSALSPVNRGYLEHRLRAFFPGIVIVRTPSAFEGIPAGLEAHYHIMTKEDYETASLQFTI